MRADLSFSPCLSSAFPCWLHVQASSLLTAAPEEPDLNPTRLATCPKRRLPRSSRTNSRTSLTGLSWVTCPPVGTVVGAGGMWGSDWPGLSLHPASVVSQQAVGPTGSWEHEVGARLVHPENKGLSPLRFAESPLFLFFPPSFPLHAPPPNVCS